MYFISEFISQKILRNLQYKYEVMIINIPLLLQPRNFNYFPDYELSEFIHEEILQA